MPKLTKEQIAQIQEYIQSLPEEQREEKLKEIMAQYENEEPQCPFCLMSEGKIKTTKIYEDNNFIAVLEIKPANIGHTLLLTKRHIKNISELNEEETDTLTKIIKKITFALSNISEGVNIIDSEGKTAGQRFDHFTINLIPRFKEDSVKILWQPQQPTEDQLNKVKEAIIGNIPKDKPKSEPLDEDYLKKQFYKTRKKMP